MNQLLVLILQDVDRTEEVLEAWRASGLGEITVVQSAGWRGYTDTTTKDDIPLFPSMKDMVELEEAPSMILLALDDDETIIDSAIQRTKDALHNSGGPHRGRMLVLPVTKVIEIGA